MFRPRIIPVLLLKGKGLVKTVHFKNPRYIGDPINAVKIFNDLGADELVFLDIMATLERRTIFKDLVKEIGDEAYMPFSVGGGINSVTQIGELLSLGAEKVVINTGLYSNFKLIEDAASVFGNQSLIGSVDVNKNFMGTYNVFIECGKRKTSLNLVNYIKSLENAGIGELMINSIDRDGSYIGYDLKLIKTVAENLSVPVIACGGAGSLNDLRDAHKIGGASACAAGSIFVYHGPRRGVLVNYPEKKEIIKLFGENGI